MPKRECKRKNCDTTKSLDKRGYCKAHRFSSQVLRQIASYYREKQEFAFYEAIAKQEFGE